MLFKKINLELIVVADEVEAIVAELNSGLDRLEERHSLFGGGIEIEAVEPSGTQTRSALAHTMAAGEKTLKAAKQGLAVALHAVI
jgi:signal transduction histidine kinase